MLERLDFLRELNMGSVIVRLALAMFFGGVIGLEGARKGRPAGFRTYMLVCVGAALTMLLGQYEYMLNALHQLHFAEIITFVVGALIGILGFSRILNFLLKNHKEVTMAFLIGVMLGSLRVPAVEIVHSVSVNFSGLLPCLIVAIIAFVLIIILETRFDYID